MIIETISNNCLRDLNSVSFPLYKVHTRLTYFFYYSSHWFSFCIIILLIIHECHSHKKLKYYRKTKIPSYHCPYHSSDVTIIFYIDVLLYFCAFTPIYAPIENTYYGYVGLKEKTKQSLRDLSQYLFLFNSYIIIHTMDILLFIYSLTGEHLVISKCVSIAL